MKTRQVSGSGTLELRSLLALVGFTVASCGHAGPVSPALQRQGANGDASSQSPFLIFDAGHPSCPEGGSKVKDAAAFGDGGAACTPSRVVSYRNDVIPILTGNCNGEVCHNGTWGSSSAAESLIDVRAPECCDGRSLVKPGDPDHSYLVQKLRGRDLCMGRKMPLDHTLSDANVTTLTDWVCEGAPH